MITTYRNNRLVPAVFVAVCFVLFFYLLDPSARPNSDYEYGPGFDADGLSAHHEVEMPPGAKDVPVPPISDVEKDAESARSPIEATEGLRQEVQPEAHRETHHGTPSTHAVAGGSLTGDDVLLMVKTGGTTMWKRLLVHLSTTLDPDHISQDNVVIYSDLAESVGKFQVVDVLANLSKRADGNQDFDVYHQQPEYMAHNYYVEASGVAGDEWGPVGGWIIDKYKFVPLVQHAGTNWPRAKWYIYMEDDTYLFLPAVLRHLSSFDWRQPHYLGSFAAKSDFAFAHGGAGFAVSRGAWEKTFGSYQGDIAEETMQYTAEHCCGDQVLGYALQKYGGVGFGENGGDGKFTWGFNPVVHWAFVFSRHNWCSPLLSWHKVHSRDVARYFELEQSWDYTKKPMLHRDFFNAMILPNIQHRAEWWDNMAGAYEVTSGNKAAPPAPPDGSSYSLAKWTAAWESADACEAACESWSDCVMWTFVEDLCRMDHQIAMGQGYAPGMPQRKTSLKHTSGWMVKRLEKWNCA